VLKPPRTLPRPRCRDTDPVSVSELGPAELDPRILRPSRQAVGAGGVLFESYNDWRSPAMSTTTGPQASDDDKNEPEPQDVEKSAGKEKAVAGAEIGIMPQGEGSSFEPEEDPEAQS